MYNNAIVIAVFQKKKKRLRPLQTSSSVNKQTSQQIRKPSRKPPVTTASSKVNLLKTVSICRENEDKENLPAPDTVVICRQKSVDNQDSENVCPPLQLSGQYTVCSIQYDLMITLPAKFISMPCRYLLLLVLGVRCISLDDRCLYYAVIFD